MTDILTDEDLRTEAVKEPPKRWRNWGLLTAPREGVCVVCNAVRRLEVGALYKGCCLSWPSKDVAETFASQHRTAGVFYLGAFPVESDQ